MVGSTLDRARDVVAVELRKERELAAEKVTVLPEVATQVGWYDLGELVARLEAVEIHDAEMHLAGLIVHVDGNAGVISWTNEDDLAEGQGELVVRIESAFDKWGNHFDQLIQRIIIDGLRRYVDGSPASAAA